MKRLISWMGIATLAMAGVTLAHGTEKKQEVKTVAAQVDQEAVTRGKALFGKKCAVCHNAESERRKIGPGLKGLNHRGTFRVNGNKVNDKTLKTWIENGDNQMPPFKDALSADEIRDLVQYVRAL